MAIVYADRVRFSTATVGTGTLTAGGPSAGFQTPAQASIPTGSTVGYVIEDGTAWEVGVGTYTSVGTTLSRDTVEGSSLGGTTKISLSGSAVVFFTVVASQAASYVTQAQLAAPPAIGNTTPAAADFTRLQAHAGTFEASQAMAANAIDLALASFFTKTITANTTFTLANVPASGVAASFILELRNGGAFTLTWWANVRWPAAVAPALTVSGVDILGFYTVDGGANWRGMVLARDSR